MSEIDQKALDKVRALQRPGTPDLLGRIVDIFVVQAPKEVASIIDALESEDFESISISAHSVKSSSAYVGAIQFSARMADIERAAREGNLHQCQELVSGLKQHSHDVIGELLSLQDKAA